MTELDFAMICFGLVLLTFSVVRRSRAQYPRTDMRIVFDAMRAVDDVTAMDLCKMTKLGTGRIYVALARLEHLGAVEGRFDDATGYPRRRRYNVTAAGRLRFPEQGEGMELD